MSAGLGSIGERPGGTKFLPQTPPRSSQQTLFSRLLRPQLQLPQATFGWKAGHPAVPGPPALLGRTECTVTEQLLAERFSSDRQLLLKTPRIP